MLSFFEGNEDCIAITGSGGKTTSMTRLAALYAKTNRSVLMSTTTKLMLPSAFDYGCDTTFHDDSILSYKPKGGERVLYGIEGGKLLAPPTEHLKRLLSAYDVMLIEADGSRQLGLKIHSERDPVVPPFVTATLAVASFSTLGKPFGEHCFNAELFPDDFPDTIVTIDTFRRLLSHPQGILKGARGKRLVLFNQTEQMHRERCIELSAKTDCPVPIFFGSLHLDTLLYRNIP